MKFLFEPHRSEETRASGEGPEVCQKMPVASTGCNERRRYELQPMVGTVLVHRFACASYGSVEDREGDFEVSDWWFSLQPTAADILLMSMHAGESSSSLPYTNRDQRTRISASCEAT